MPSYSLPLLYPAFVRVATFLFALLRRLNLSILPRAPPVKRFTAEPIYPFAQN